MEKLVFGPGKPGDCPETEISLQDAAYYISNIAHRYGQNVNPDEITTENGTRLDSFSSRKGIIYIPGVLRSRREIKADIRNELGLNNIEFGPNEAKSDAASYSTLDPYIS